MRTVVGLPKNCKDNTEIPYTSHPVSPVINILNYYRAFVTANTDTVLLTKVHTLFRFS